MRARGRETKILLEVGEEEDIIRTGGEELFQQYLESGTRDPDESRLSSKDKKAR
jgi:hypothetical protein